MEEQKEWKQGINFSGMQELLENMKMAMTLLKDQYKKQQEDMIRAKNVRKHS